MQRLHLSLNDAYDFVKRKKSNISPNFNFMGQLLDFERTLGLHSPCDNCSTNQEQLFFTTPTNHNVFQLDTLESTWDVIEQPFFCGFLRWLWGFWAFQMADIYSTSVTVFLHQKELLLYAENILC